MRLPDSYAGWNQKVDQRTTARPSGGTGQPPAPPGGGGASLLCGHLAEALGTGGFHRVDVSRLVMDFNRFPGSTPPRAPHLGKLARAIFEKGKTNILEGHATSEAREERNAAVVRRRDPAAAREA